MFEVESFYENLGYRGEALRKVLMKDKEYQEMLRRKRMQLIKKFKISSNELKKYVLSTERDFEILQKCKMLEKLKLSKDDRKLVELIKSQLKFDWRKSLIRVLNRLLKKYGHISSNDI